MARLNVYVPDDLARRAREANLNVSKLTQDAIAVALGTSDLRRWLDEVCADPPLKDVPRERIRQALDEAREELWGGRPGD